jgi:endogenous inhibitor of DNA gyrase (YacG/DUF329 family)
MIECTECGKGFKPNRPHQHFCSKKCHDAYWNKLRYKEIKVLREQKRKDRWRDEFVY